MNIFRSFQGKRYSFVCIVNAKQFFLFILLLTQFNLAGQHMVTHFGDSTVYQAPDTAVQTNIRIQRELQKQFSMGYLSAYADSLVWFGDTVHLYIAQGPLYEFKQVILPGRQRKNKRESLQASTEVIQALADQLIEPYENRGYPFASVQFVVEADIDSALVLSAQVAPGKWVSVDSLLLKGEKKFSQAYFQQYLNMRKGHAYSEEEFRDIARKLSELNFVAPLRSPEALFHSDGVDVSCYLKDRKANRFDGIIGFQPDAATGKIVLTGNATLGLVNALRRGEEFNLEWKRLQFQTQDLRVDAHLPYVAATKIGMWGKMQLYRRDTTFTTTTLYLSAGLVLGQGKYLRGTSEWYNSNALRENVPGLNNVSIRRYGIAFRTFRTDFNANPMKGFLTDFAGDAGIKSTPLTDGTTARSNQFTGQFQARAWLPVFSRLSVVVGIQAGGKLDSALTTNEHYRIGGLTTLRGFNEESLFASAYGIGSLELKYAIDQTSALFLFLDQAWYERTDAVYFTDQPYGVGAGVLLGTQNGSFSLFYALGSQQDQALLFRDGKVHFGFINRF
ncbi:MAG: hypothetical protein RL226_1543 [Bacteroidota bacterium]